MGGSLVDVTACATDADQMFKGVPCHFAAAPGQGVVARTSRGQRITNELQTLLRSMRVPPTLTYAFYDLSYGVITLVRDMRLQGRRIARLVVNGAMPLAQVGFAAWTEMMRQGVPVVENFDDQYERRRIPERYVEEEYRCGRVLDVPISVRGVTTTGQKVLVYLDPRPKSYQ